MGQNEARLCLGKVFVFSGIRQVRCLRGYRKIADFRALDNFCHKTVQCGRLLQKKTKSSELSFAALWLVPSPGYLPNRTNLLVEGQKSLASDFAGDRSTCRLNANHSIFKRAEAADTRLVGGNRNARRIVNRERSTTRAGRRERVTALGSKRQNVVDQAGSARGR